MNDVRGPADEIMKDPVHLYVFSLTSFASDIKNRLAMHSLQAKRSPA